MVGVERPDWMLLFSITESSTGFLYFYIMVNNFFYIAETKCNISEESHIISAYFSLSTISNKTNLFYIHFLESIYHILQVNWPIKPSHRDNANLAWICALRFHSSVGENIVAADGSHQPSSQQYLWWLPTLSIIGYFSSSSSSSVPGPTWLFM